MTTSPPIVADLDSWFANTLGGAGNGKGDRMGVGMGTGDWAWQNRLAMRFPRPDAQFAAIPSAEMISAAASNLRASNALFGIGANVKFYLELGTAAFTENNQSDRDFVTTSGASTSEWPGPTTTTSGRAEYQGSPGNNDWIAVNVLDLVRWWWAQPAGTPLIVVAKASDGAGGYAESTTGRRCVFYTRQSGSAPYITFDSSSDLPPNIPTDLAPADGAKVPSIDSTSASVTFRYTQPGGIAASKYQAQWWPSAATDDDAGNVTGATVTKDQTVAAAIANNALKTHSFSGLATRTAGKWRVRTFAASQWGPWSRLQSATTAFQPSVVNPSTTPGTVTPDFLDSIVSNDSSDFATAYQDVVYQDTPAGTITKQDTGKQSVGGSATRVSRTYNGDALIFGTPYRRRRRLWNRDDVPTTADADWPSSAIDVPFTQYAPLGGQAKIGSSGGPLWNADTLIGTTTPALYGSDPNGSNIDQVEMRLRNESAALIWDSGVVSHAAAASILVNVPSGVLTPGMNPTLEVAVRISGNADMGPFSTPAAGHVNSTPGAPFPVIVVGAVQREDGVWVTTDSTPDVVFPYRDADVELGYTDPPSRQEVTITHGGSAFASSPYIDSSSPVETWTAPTLTAGETYVVAGRYDDTAAFRSLFSTDVSIKYQTAPALSSVTPADAATITDPTPTFAWSFSRDVAAWSLVVSSGDTELLNTGLVTADDEETSLDAGVLPNATEITWTLTVYDADGLSDTITRTFTTDFSVPDPITGLTLTVDYDNLGLLIGWDATELDPEEFLSYDLEASVNGGAFRSIAPAIVDPDSTALLFIGAGHNVETIVRITQSNGYASSDPVQASETLGAPWGTDGYLAGIDLVRPSDVIALPAPRHGQGDTHTDLEILDPPGRGEKLILNWGSTGYEATISILTRDVDLLAKLRRIKEAGTVYVLKKWDGAVRYVKLVSTPDTDGTGGLVAGDISYIEVLPDPEIYGF